jgi:hypothetical protein
MQSLHTTQLLLTVLLLSTTYAGPLISPIQADDVQSTTETKDRGPWSIYQYNSTDCSGDTLFATGTETVDCTSYNGTHAGSATTTGNTDYNSGGWYYCLWELPDCQGIGHQIRSTRQCVAGNGAWKIQSISITPGHP